MEVAAGEVEGRLVPRGRVSERECVGKDGQGVERGKTTTLNSNAT